MTDKQKIEYLATTLVRISQSMQSRVADENKIVASEAHGFDLEAMDQYATQVRSVAEMLRMGNM